MAALTAPASARPASVRLTRRGRRLVAVLVALPLATGLLVGGRAAVAGIERQPAAPAQVVVLQPGETLWDLAVRVDPHADPRDTVARLRELNSLGTEAVRPGQPIVLPRG